MTARKPSTAPRNGPVPGTNTTEGSGLEDDLDVDAVRNLDAHHLSERALVGVDVDQSLVDPHLPMIDRARPPTIGTLADGDLETLRGKRDRSRDIHSGLEGDFADLLADRVDLSGVRPGERDASF